MNEDSQLMVRFQAGDCESFERLVIKYRNKALAFAMGYIHDPHMAEDVVQESFADLYVYRHRYREGYSFKTYIFTIVKNKSIDYIRKKRDISSKDIILEDECSPEQKFLQKEERNIIRRKIGEMKKDYQTAIYLVEYEDFSYEEIAKIMGKNLGQVKVLIHRARKKLKTMLEKEV